MSLNKMPPPTDAEGSERLAHTTREDTWWERRYQWSRFRVILERWVRHESIALSETTGDYIELSIPRYWLFVIRVRLMRRFGIGRLPCARVVRR